MFIPDKDRKWKQANTFICHRRLAIYKKKIYRNRPQLIYVSLSGDIYTHEDYREAVQVDNDIRRELSISNTGKRSSIHDVNLLYSRVNNLMNFCEDKHLDEKMFEYYCIPRSIIREYNSLGIYELYKEQADCLRNVLQNEEVERNVRSKVEDMTPEERTFENGHSQKIDSFSNEEFFTSLEEINQNDEEKGGREISPQRGPTSVHLRDDKWDIPHLNNDSRNNFFYKNFLFNIPTGMGKTIIYDILIIRQVLYKGYRAILCLPTMSLINEKYDYYEKLLGEKTVWLNIKKFNSSNASGYSYQLCTDIAICTYEQANIILNIIIKNNLKYNYIFIIDEIHYLNDDQRGIFIESLLTKVKYIQRNYDSDFKIRVYGFSATLSNVNQIGEWLDAKVHVSKEKLQNIKHLYKINNAIYKDIHGKQLERSLEVPFYLDPDHLVYLLSEELILQRNVLIFCPTKKKCEKVAYFISNVMPYYLKNRNYQVKREVVERRVKLVNELKERSVIIPVLDKLILSGIFYHHADLQSNERGIVEGAFRSNTLFCLCCTTTLSVGVSFNVHTIIIRNIRLGNNFLTRDQIMQISGRCGRMKKVRTGENSSDGSGGPISTVSSVVGEALSGRKVSTEAATYTPVKDYDEDCDGKVLVFLERCDKKYMEKILKDDVDLFRLKTKLNNFQFCKFIVELIQLNLIKTKKNVEDFLLLYTLKFFKLDERGEKKSSTDCITPVNYRDLMMQEIKQTFQYLFENKLILIPYDKEQSYYYYLFAKIYNVNLYQMEHIFNFHFLCQYINVDTLLKCNLPQKVDLFKKLHRNYKQKEYKDEGKQKPFFSLPFLTILLIFKDTKVNTNIFQNLSVQFVKYLFLVNINSKQFDFFVYDILRDDDVIGCTEVSSYVHPILNALDFIFSFSFMQYVYFKGFPTDVLLMIFVFCIHSDISLKIDFDVYEQILTSRSGPDGGDVRRIFHYFDLSMDKLKRFKDCNSEDLCAQCAQCAKKMLQGEINIDEIYENFEWVKIKRFYFSLIVYDLFTEDIHTVGRKYRVKTNDIKYMYSKCFYNLSFNCKILRNFKNSLDIFCIVLDNLLIKMRSRNLAFTF
ncbi:Helicase [Plasmodium coatneyi]|uniref:Helicase n=1 Tax=Plasmodium coatneyi TaxID=208452 RepID=A0A1B1E5W5_9APIC|nr:Helicase [Plasmodium coatneyi]ANQ10378.1 Helicase [Plasmodium coatneyi]